MAEAEQAHPQAHQYAGLDGLRGLAALAVLSAHTAMLFSHTPRHFFLAVDFFFILSGFVLTIPLVAPGRSLDARAFYGRRMWRILPSYWTALAFAWERRHGRPGLAARIGLGIALVQAVAGLVSGTAIGYFAPPVIVNAAYGLAFLVSVAIGRPLAGVFAVESYPIPPEIRAMPAFRRAFTHISIVWGVYLLSRSVLRKYQAQDRPVRP